MLVSSVFLTSSLQSKRNYALQANYDNMRVDEQRGNEMMRRDMSTVVSEDAIE